VLTDAAEEYRFPEWEVMRLRCDAYAISPDTRYRIISPQRVGGRTMDEPNQLDRRLKALSEAVEDIEVRVSVHGLLLNYIVKSVLLQTGDTAASLGRRITKEIQTTIDTARREHVYTETKAEKMRMAIEALMSTRG
jgi:hypothetical protein